MEGKIISIDIPSGDRTGKPKVLDLAFSSFFVQLPHKLQNCLKNFNGKSLFFVTDAQSQLKRLAKDNDGIKSLNTFLGKEKGSSAELGIDLEKQLQAWRENPSWVNLPPEIKVSVPKGSLCNLKAKVDVGLPPDAVYNIVTDPDSKRVFKNIKELISRKVLVDEGQRQVVEVEQAALWRFPWWSETISVHVLVDQNREDHLMKFKQVNMGFMKKFEGHWRVESIFVDEKICLPFKPKTWTEYCSCTGGKGMIYLLKLPDSRVAVTENSNKEFRLSKEINEHGQVEQICNIKERWNLRRRIAKEHCKKLLTAESSTF